MTPAPSTNLGEFEQVVLLAVLRVGEEAYANPLLEEIGKAGGREVARGALYTALDRLEQKGLLRSRLGEPLAERGGRARRYYAVTARGLSALKESRRSLLRLWDGLEGTLGKP
jgi:DNA-binding PadR family transcriptional regulator